jgi:hypothetical protein
MYSGLFMAPWILVYAISGFLFNHWALFNADSEHEISSAVIAKTAISRIPTADTVAQRLVSILNTRRDSDGKWEISSDERPHFSNDWDIGQLSEEGRVSGLRVDLDRRVGSLTLSQWPKPSPSGDMHFNGLEKPILDDDLKAAIYADAFALAPPGQKPARKFDKEVKTPEVVFLARHQNKSWLMSYSLADASLNAKPTSSLALSFGDFMKRLHTTSGYPVGVQPRLFWSIVADAVALLMCFWVVTGIAMWIQMKELRSWGLVVVALAVIVAWMICSGMHRQFLDG